MSDEMQVLKNEIASLAGESLALQALVFYLLVEMRRANIASPELIEKVFDSAANLAEAGALKLGSRAHPAQLPGALKIVEQLRTQFLKTQGRT